MNRSLKYYLFITLFAGSIILYNQLIYIYQLWQYEKTTYINQQNEWITDAIYEFNIKTADFKQSTSFNPQNNRLIYIINNQVFQFQLDAKEKLYKIGNRTYYDILDSSRWTLENALAYLQTKQEANIIQNFKLAIKDSANQIKDSYPPDWIPSHSCKLNIPLGFISKDTLHVSYDYPFKLLWKMVSGQILLITSIALLLISCIISLFHTLRGERRAGKYREIFVHNIVHDLKHPIENELKLHHVLYKTLSPQQKSLLDKSKTGLNNMLQSINRMLLQSTDAQGLRLNIKDFDLYEMLTQLKALDLWNIGKDKQVDIQLQYFLDQHVITGDPDFLQPVFSNLIENALKYSGKQVYILITCEETDRNTIRVKVSDNGMGISPQALKHIFEQYNRGDQQDNTNIKGHGQGLYFARLVVRAHGGSITAESEEGVGSTFIITLPKK